MPSLAEVLASHAGPALIAALGAAALAVLLALWLAIRLRRVERAWKRVVRAAPDQNAADTLLRQVDRLEEIGGRLATAETELTHLSRLIEGCVQHVGLIRYDAFEEVGGLQSFSVALLDGQRDGIVISGIYSRSDMRVYIKLLKEGRAATTMTKEEMAAVGQALGASRA